MVTRIARTLCWDPRNEVGVDTGEKRTDEDNKDVGMIVSNSRWMR